MQASGRLCARDRESFGDSRPFVNVLNLGENLYSM
jgi:hypothetical protein